MKEKRENWPNKRRGWFLNFVDVPLICHIKNKIHCGKCKHKGVWRLHAALFGI
jgi:hypothetical protein